MQVYYDLNKLQLAIPYAKLVLSISNNPNYVSNAYYCLMQDAKNRNKTELLSQYAHARTDAQQLLREYMLQDAEAIPILEEYLQNPYPLRWVWIVMCAIVALCFILIISIIIYRKHTTTQIKVSNDQIVSLSVQIQAQQDELQKQNELQQHEKRLKSIRKKYPKPLNRWNDYSQLKQDVQPYLQNWLSKLESLGLTDREKVFCVLSFVYPQMAAEDLASVLCITKEALIVRKNRIAKKLGITSVELGVFLQTLANND